MSAPPVATWSPTRPLEVELRTAAGLALANGRAAAATRGGRDMKPRKKPPPRPGQEDKTRGKEP